MKSIRDVKIDWENIRKILCKLIEIIIVPFLLGQLI